MKTLKINYIKVNTYTINGIKTISFLSRIFKLLKDDVYCSVISVLYALKQKEIYFS